MTGALRRAGRGRLADGTSVTWTVAEGNRGRRWRWALSRDGALASIAVAELDDRGLFARLELTTADGLLTFHPEPDGASAHGNVVGGDGVRPIATPWEAGWGIELEGDPFGSAVLAGRETMLAVSGELALRPTADEPSMPPLSLDSRGIPGLRDAREWPLEE
jgi:hypothetical protein